MTIFNLFCSLGNFRLITILAIENNAVVIHMVVIQIFGCISYFLSVGSRSRLTRLKM